MIETKRYRSRPTASLHGGIALFFLLSLLLLGPGQLANAQNANSQPARAQSLTGSLKVGDWLVYRLPDLQSGQTLYVYMDATSGNLDPVVALLDGTQDPQTVELQYRADIQKAMAEDDDPLLATQEALGRYFLAWDDDGGEGLAAALAFEVPADGDYQLIVSSALSAHGKGTFGGYHLLVGVDAPEVLSGQADPTGDSLAILDREASPPGEAVQEISGTLGEDQESHILDLYDLRAGDTLYVFAEATSGDWRPAVVLRNFADKPVRTANLNGSQPNAVLEYTLDEAIRNAKLEIMRCCDEQQGAGDHRLLVGLNAPEVLTGEALPQGQPLVQTSIPVQIGLKVQQIVEVDEQNEFFTVVASLQMEWTDPRLAFSPESCDCVVKTYTGNTFTQFVKDYSGWWPDFTLYNQQGNRWTQNQVAVVDQNGKALYFERFSTNLQVDFDFRRYPFDRQEFIVRIDSLFPEDFYHFTNMEGYSEISPEHGEDEFVIDEFETAVTSEQASTRNTISRFTTRFGGPRHLNYYLLQIFVPILLIASVSWITFFLRDYGRRIEVASANLLVFIAFSFSLSGNYPRLGYLTLLDSVMVVVFAVNALVVVYSVWLRRLEMNGQAELAERIDSVLDWVYPLAYVAAGVGLTLVFF